MSVSAELVRQVLAQSSTAGDELPPTALLEAATDDPSPLAALSDLDRGNALFTAFDQAFGFMNFVRASQKPSSNEDEIRLAGLMRWAIRSLREWRLSDDPNYARLVSLLVVTRRCEQMGGFWSAIPDEAANVHLQDELLKLLSKLEIKTGLPHFSHQPILEGEALERFNEADANGDWVTLAEQMRVVETRMLPSTFFSEAVQYLRRYSKSKLAEALSGIRQIIVAMLLLESLDDKEACELALASGNPYVEFVAVYRLTSRRTASGDDGGETEGLLADLFAKAASDPAKWKQWMRAFNRYPLRHPTIATALGKALGVVSDEAAKDYVYSIALTTMMPASREVVAATLMEFRKAASEPRQRALWRYAYDRWREWDFGSTDKAEHFTTIAHSELDYAVVGFVITCMSPEERQQALGAIVESLSKLELKWHADITAFSREKNLLLSRFQPIAYGRDAPSEWLAKGNYLPFDPKVDRYNALLLGMA